MTHVDPTDTPATVDRRRRPPTVAERIAEIILASMKPEDRGAIEDADRSLPSRSTEAVST